MSDAAAPVRPSLLRRAFGTLLAFLVACGATSAAGLFLVVFAFQAAEESRTDALQMQWELQDATLYARDLSAGETPREDDLMRQPVPSMLVTPRTLRLAPAAVPPAPLAVAVHEGDAVRSQDFGAPREGQLPPLEGESVWLRLGAGSQNMRAGDRVTLVRLHDGEAFIVEGNVRVRSFLGAAPPGPLSGDAPVLLEVSAETKAAIEQAGEDTTFTAFLEPRR